MTVDEINDVIAFVDDTDSIPPKYAELIIDALEFYKEMNII